MGADKWANRSRLRRVDPLPKLVLALTALLVCLCCGSGAVGLATVIGMGALIVGLGGLPLRVYLRFLTVPLAFLALGCATMLARPYPLDARLLAALPIGGRLWGFDGAALAGAAGVFCTALGCVGAMYFLALNTPMTDLAMEPSMSGEIVLYDTDHEAAEANAEVPAVQDNIAAEPAEGTGTAVQTVGTNINEEE